MSSIAITVGSELKIVVAIIIVLIAMNLNQGLPAVLSVSVPLPHRARGGLKPL